MTVDKDQPVYTEAQIAAYTRLMPGPFSFLDPERQVDDIALCDVLRPILHQLHVLLVTLSIFQNNAEADQLYEDDLAVLLSLAVDYAISAHHILDAWKR